MNRQSNKWQKSQRRFMGRAIAFCIIIGTLAIGCFLFFQTDLFSHEEATPGTFTLIEPANGGLPKPAEPEYLPLKNKKKTVRPTASSIASIHAASSKNTLISEKEDKNLLAKKLAENKKSIRLVKHKRKSSKTYYEVVSVAHFYNKPNEQTRRKDSISYWNQSFASIKPIIEKNGFVFVAFKYPSGHRSKGWLRKKDLKKVNTAYENSKE